MRIILIEDDTLLADGLRRALNRAGYVVDHAADGGHADTLLRTEEYALAVLDLGLPGLDGSEVLRRLRARRNSMPVLVLSARQMVDERVRVLDLGADDYVVKPITTEELEARIRALTRRQQGGGSAELQLGELRIDQAGKRAWLAGQPLEMNGKEWATLSFLVSKINRIVSKEQMIQALYEDAEEISQNAVEKMISRLRGKLEPAGITIRTVRGLGYYLEKPEDAG